ncbi:twin-arginine translocase TatA/TatE family subunit [Paenibacillus yanchengensis]|uniref:Sec-independent protein translocase protein TatA n=1 Tax=Paenibacillus yanchengensis TaxID=2035833 RepID=A0ABW4YGH9_9BACL
MNIGPTGIILLVIVALLLFGPKRLPELGRAVGRTLREFKSGAREMMNEEDQQKRKESQPVEYSDNSSKRLPE